MNTLALAQAVVAAWDRRFRAVRPIDIRIATAELQGFFKAISALGLANTPFAAEFILISAVREMPSVRPAPQFASSRIMKEVREWDEELAVTYVKRLEKGE